MNLLIDIGNTRLKWATFNNDEFEFGGSISYSEDDILSLMLPLWGTLPTPEQVIISNVAGNQIEEIFHQWFMEHFHCKVRFLESQANYLGLINAYTLPEQLGIDRWVSMLTLWDELHSGFCLVDVGTAVTFDAVDHSGKHLGGLIIPGLDMMNEVLRDQLPGCNQYPLENEGKVKHLLADDTYSAISGGCLYTIIAFINHLTEDLAEVLGNDVPCFISGGNAKMIAPLLANEFILRKHLVLRGLTLYTN